MARPELYTDEIAEKICELIAGSSSGLHTICNENPDLPSFRTIMNWLNDGKHPEFLHKYARARDSQADFLADEILQISDDSTKDSSINAQGDVTENKEWVNRSRLRVEARKWVASKLKPKKYGEKLDVTAQVEVSKTEYDFSLLNTDELDTLHRLLAKCVKVGKGA